MEVIKWLAGGQFQLAKRNPLGEKLVDFFSFKDENREEKK
jgi:hypothetical protein